MSWATGGSYCEWVGGDTEREEKRQKGHLSRKKCKKGCQILFTLKCVNIKIYPKQPWGDSGYTWPGDTLLDTDQGLVAAVCVSRGMSPIMTTCSAAKAPSSLHSADEEREAHQGDTPGSRSHG